MNKKISGSQLRSQAATLYPQQCHDGNPTLGCSGSSKPLGGVKLHCAHANELLTSE